MMKAGVDPEKISSPSSAHGLQSGDLDPEIISGHGLQSEDLNIMTAVVGSGDLDPEIISGHGLQSEDLNIMTAVVGSGHALQSDDPNIASQVESNDRKRKCREERPEEGAAVVTPRPRGRPKGSRNKPRGGNDERPKEGGAVVTPRPRGKPKGSRNKLEDPLSGISEMADTMNYYAFEIPSGNDVWNTLETFARRSHMGLFILSGTGMVSDVILRHPTAFYRRTYSGQLRILSLSGVFPPHATDDQQATGITVSLANEQGVIVAGSIVGSLVAFGSVFVVAGTVAHIRCEPQNVQPMPVQPMSMPMPVQPCKLLQSWGRTEVEQQMTVPVIGSHRNAATDKHDV